ncbi:MAG TPA: ATP:cob(I)alamin adenosyltransferase [Deltaproteobacteria bacterium]|nr:ATP:cob(I)alamin adenosyltransferase [Deltaproteobacteria bacterium]
MKIYTKRGDGGMTDLPGGRRISKSHPRLEALGAIDHMEEKLPPLRHFLLPGGHAAASAAHLARTVCRRAERRVADLIDLEKETAEEVPREPVAFLNRLSDYLFVLARHLNRITGTGDGSTV